MRKSPHRARKPPSAEELLDVAGKTSRQVWQKLTRTHYFVFAPPVLDKLAYFCGIDHCDSPEREQRRAAFDAYANEAARTALGLEILRKGRPSRARIKEAAIQAANAAKRLQKVLEKNRWKVTVAGITPPIPLKENAAPFENSLVDLIRRADDAVAENWRGGNRRKFETTPAKMFAVVFYKHFFCPPEKKCSPRCHDER